MNSKNLKKSSWDKSNASTKNGDPEVLVLPPDILQKLGINLGTIEDSNESCLNNDNLNDGNDEPKSTSDPICFEKFFDNDSSFLETADLMNDSVLLHSTFNKSNLSLDELEIMHTNKNDNEDEVQQKKSPLDITNDELMHAFDSSIEANNIGIVQEKNKFNITKGKLQSTSNKAEVEEKLLNSKEMKEKHIVHISKRVCEPETSEPKNQINIISQEVIGINNIGKLKCLTPSDKKNMIPLSIDTILPNNKIHKREQNQFKPIISNENQKVYIETLKKDVQKDSKKEITLEVDEFNNILNTEDKQVERSKRRKSHVITIEGLIESYTDASANNILNDGNENVCMMSPESCMLRNKEENDIDKELNLEENLVKSKLCIQGVEKPGGEVNIFINNIEIQCIRTYSRSEKTKALNLNALIPSCESLFVSENEIQHVAEPCSNIKKSFCLCADFGRFSFYDVIANYEHLHFEDHKPVCSLETLYSIYEDSEIPDIIEKDIDNVTFEPDMCVEGEISRDGSFVCYKVNTSTVLNNSKDSIPLQNNEVNETSSDFIIKENICVIEKEDDIFETDQYENEQDNETNQSSYSCESSDINDAVTSKHIKLLNSTMECDEFEITDIKNRKRSKPASLSDKPSPKRVCTADNIQCGVCKQNIDRADWKNHISSEHDYIAWPEGETLDLDSKKLIRKLNGRLNETGKIICTFCDTEITELGDFMDHIRICMNRQLNPSNWIKCGVCQNLVERNLWIVHICREHNYLAWEDGETPLDLTDKNKILKYLNITNKAMGGLECNKCGTKRKFVKSFVRHLKMCSNIEIIPSNHPDGDYIQSNNYVTESITDNITDKIKEDVTDNATENVKENVTENARDNIIIDDNNSSNIYVEVSIDCGEENLDYVKCGVCHEDVERQNWINHICMNHNYAAWMEGEEPFDVKNIKELSDRLYPISKAEDGLICSKCGLRRKYVKSFLTHIKSCDGNMSRNTSLNESSVIESSVIERPVEDVQVQCGVCSLSMSSALWHRHIQREHSYLAWQKGEKPIDFTKEENVHTHLQAMSKQYDGLCCYKCGLIRKYVRVFLNHTQNCDSNVSLDCSRENAADGNNDGTCECAVCGEVVDKRDFKSHAMKVHYNIAWIVGDYPIDVKNPSVIEKYLKEYKALHKKLVCTLCGLVRASILGFYAHVIQCGKTEEEIETYKNYCEICNNKYLCIYMKQHLSSHRDQELKLLIDSNQCIVPKEEEISSEGRMAARKARNVIEKYRSHEFNCSVCGYGADEEKELEEHDCSKMSVSDSEVSLKLEESSSDESDLSVVESDLSDLVVKKDRKRRNGDHFSAASKIKRIPFDTKNPKMYLQQAGQDYVETYLSNKELYLKWRECKYEIVPDEEEYKYMPPLKESCKLKYSKAEWAIFQRFEARKDCARYTLFAGSSVQCVAWAPGEAQQLAVACHNSTDTPRLHAATVHVARNLLQIWDFAEQDKNMPKFALGIAHEYGIVWGMDWCPSGAGDKLDKNATSYARLGLLAIACSNGYAYVLSVPYPSTMTKGDKKIYKLHPVAELRLSRGERQIFQATSISWSAQSDHASVVVGYSDGTIALYDLQTESPLLTDKKEDVTIFYPYHEERPHNTCVTGVTTFPLALGGRELVSSASPTGAECWRRGGGRLRTQLACSAARHAPHWPSVLLAENDSIVNQAINELDWWCSGRRLGALHSCGGCMHCGQLVTYAPPALRLMKPHPVYPDLSKETLAIIHMVSLSEKRSKLKNDDFTVKLEPLTYDEAIKTYGLEIKFAKELDRKHMQILSNEEQCPERFPLADVPSMAFNPSVKYHKQLAVATHSGFIFVLNV